LEDGNTILAHWLVMSALLEPYLEIQEVLDPTEP